MPISDFLIYTYDLFTYPFALRRFSPAGSGRWFVLFIATVVGERLS